MLGIRFLNFWFPRLAVQAKLKAGSAARCVGTSCSLACFTLPIDTRRMLAGALLFYVITMVTDPLSKKVGNAQAVIDWFFNVIEEDGLLAFGVWRYNTKARRGIRIIRGHDLPCPLNIDYWFCKFFEGVVELLV